MSTYLPGIRFTLTMLMLIMLFLPFPWVSYGSGHYLNGCYFILGALIEAWRLFWWGWRVPWWSWAELWWRVPWWGWAVLWSGGFPLLIACNLHLIIVSAQPPWLKWSRRALGAISLFAGLMVGVTWPRGPDSNVFINFWVAVGLVSINVIIEVLEYIKGYK